MELTRYFPIVIKISYVCRPKVPMIKGEEIQQKLKTNSIYFQFRKFR